MTKPNRLRCSAREEDDTASRQSFEHAQFWIKLTLAAFNQLDPVTLKVDYQESEVVAPDGINAVTYAHHLVWQFSEGATIPAVPVLP